MWWLIFNDSAYSCFSIIDFLKDLSNESILHLTARLIACSHFVTLTILQLTKLQLKGLFWINLKELKFNYSLLYLNVFVSLILTIYNLSDFFVGTRFQCVDVFNVKSYTIQWLDWLFTVQYMIFVLSIIFERKDDDKRFQKNLVWQNSGSLAILSLFGTNFDSLSVNLRIFFFILAHIFFTIAMIGVFYDTYRDFSETSKYFMELYNKYEEIMSKDPNSTQIIRAFKRLKRCQIKVNLSFYVGIGMFSYPISYYACLLGYISNDGYNYLTIFQNYYVKSVFMGLVYDSYSSITDPVTLHLLAERFKVSYDEGRLAFLRYVFHEVRVPLNSLTLGIDLLSDSDKISSADKGTLRLMKDSAVFMAETLNDVLSLQKIEEGKMELDFKSFRISDLVNSVLSIYKNHYESRHIAVQSIIEKDVPNIVIGDKFRLEHVLGNLLSNAIKFSDNGSTIVIAVTYGTVVYDHVTFSVIDKGIGISAEDQNLLFQSFVQIRPGVLQQGKGSGLGLTICKNLVKLHGGSIGMSSHQRIDNDKDSGGCTFFFNIKFEIGLEDEVTSPVKPVAHVSSNIDIHDIIKNVLICDG